MLYLQGKGKVFLLMIELIEHDVLCDDILPQRIYTINIRYRRNILSVTQTIHYVIKIV